MTAGRLLLKSPLGLGGAASLRASQGLSFVCRVLISQCKDISLDGGLDYSSFSLNTSLKALLPNIGIFSSAGNEHFYT